MARLARAEVFAPDEIAILHVMARVVRRCFLLGTDRFTGKNFDHRKAWIEEELKKLAANFGIDLLCFSILSNHFHLVLRSRCDVVKTWDDTEVARRWLKLCPIRPGAEEPNVADLNSIRHDQDRLVIIRRRLSDISWWMRLLCQRIAQRANNEDEEVGKFWQSRFKAVRLCDETAILACAAYVDLNPIRAAIAETLEESDYSSVQRRIQALKNQSTDVHLQTAFRNPLEQEGECHAISASGLARTDSKNLANNFISPIEIDERNDPLGPHVSSNGKRASDKGFLPLPTSKYLELLDWTARQIVAGKRGSTPTDAPCIFERLSISPSTWCVLVSNFGKLFNAVAGKPQVIDATRSRIRHHRHRMKKPTRELLQ